MRVFIKCRKTGTMIPLDVDTPDVNKVHSKVQKMLGVPADSLMFAGNPRTSFDTKEKENAVDRRKVWNNSRQIVEDSDESDSDMSVNSAPQKPTPSSGSSGCSSTQFGNSKCKSPAEKRRSQDQSPAPLKPTPTSVRESKPSSQKSKATPESKKNNKRSVSFASVEVVELSDDEPSDDAPELYYVERILDMKTVRGKRKFLVHWKGYPEDEATWECEENLGLARTLVTAYLKEAENKAKATPKSGNPGKAVNRRKNLWNNSRPISVDSDESDSEMSFAPLKPTPPPVRFERILDMKTVRGKRKFLVQWKGYSKTDAMWESEENLSLAKKLISSYLKEVGSKPKSQTAKPSPKSQKAKATPKLENVVKRRPQNSRCIVESSDDSDSDMSLYIVPQKTTPSSGRSVSSTQFGNSKCKSPAEKRRSQDQSPAPLKPTPTSVRESKPSSQKSKATPESKKGSKGAPAVSPMLEEVESDREMSDDERDLYERVFDNRGTSSQKTKDTLKSKKGGKRAPAVSSTPEKEMSDDGCELYNNSSPILEDSDESDSDMSVNSAPQKPTPSSGSSVASTQFATANSKCKSPAEKRRSQGQSPGPLKTTSTSVRESKPTSQKSEATPESKKGGQSAPAVSSAPEEEMSDDGCEHYNNSSPILEDSDESDSDMSVKSASEKTTPLSGSSASKNEEEFDENLGLAKVISAYLKEAKSKSKSPKTTSKSKKGGKRISAVSSTPDKDMSDDERELYERIFCNKGTSSQKTKAILKSKKGNKRTSSSTREQVEKRSKDGPKLYEVERILDMRLVRDKREFLVHWKGYREKEATWEPEKNLGHAREIVSAYLIEIENKPKWLRPVAVKTPNPALSQKLTLSSILRAKEQEERSSQKATPSSGSTVSSTQFGTANCKTPTGKRPSQDQSPTPLTPTQSRIQFSSPLSVTSPTAYIKFKQIGTQSPTSPSASRVHHRKVAVHQPVHPPYEEMIRTILTQMGERKALNESDLFKYLILSYKIGKDFTQIKADIKQAIKRLMIFGDIREIKGYGKGSTYQIVKKKNENQSTTSTKLNSPHSVRSLSQSMLSTSSLQTPALIRPHTSTPLWDKTSLMNIPFNGPISSSLNASPIWGTPMPFHKSSNLGYRRQADDDEVDEGIRKAAQQRKLKDTMHYLMV